MPACNLIIDSCCDLPLESVSQEGVDLLYFNYILNDTVYDDDFWQSVTPKEFYDNIREGATPSTSQVPPAVIEEHLRRAIDSGVPTVYLGFSSGLSNSFSSAETVHEQLMQEFPGAPLYLVDLKLGSTPEGLLVLEALRQRERGLTAEEMVAWAKEARYYVHTLFMVDDLDALHRGGRIPASVALVGGKLDVKPLLNFDDQGKLGLVGAARGRKKALKQLVANYVKYHEGDKAMVLVGNADCEKDAERVCDLLEKENPSVMATIHTIGATIGSHVGANMISLCFWGTDRRETMSVADKIARKVKGE